jgi:hypothetical protein
MDQRFGESAILNPPPVVYASETPFDERRVGAAAVYCSDGRFGEQMDEFLHRGLGLPRYDRVALPGGAGCLGGHTCAFHAKNALERQLEFLIREHAISRVVLIAHEGCAFYRDLWLGLRTIKEQQAVDLEKAAVQIRAVNPRVEVEIYFAGKVDGKVVFQRWTPVADREAARTNAPTPRPRGSVS